MLKDWKKTMVRKDFTLFFNKITHQYISVLKTHNKSWIISLHSGESKIFKTKAQAIKFAKEYMRKH